MQRPGIEFNAPTNYIFRPFFDDVSYTTDVATKIEEYVPTIIPTIIAKRNPLIVAPPRKNITSRTRSEVIPVFRVRLNVSFRARLRTSIVGRFL